MDKDEKEQSLQALILKVISVGADKLSGMEKEILTDVLIRNKSFAEIAKPLRQNAKRQRVIFDRAFKRLIQAIDDTNNKALAYKGLEKELTRVNGELSTLKEKMSHRSKLSRRTSELLNIPIDETDLSARVKGICSFARLRFISDLVALTRGEFLNLRNCGKLSADEVEQFLFKKGLSWGMKV